MMTSMGSDLLSATRLQARTHSTRERCRSMDASSGSPSTPALMVLGTASHVGKSLVAAALCRIFANDGVRVAPFKAQNMSLNSAATPDGGEIGRAQALQAEFARVPASVEMNPVLLKPTSDRRSQIVVLGAIAGESEAADYYADRVRSLFPIVVDAYQRLAAAHELIVLEGAGSPAEINLKANDIVNLRMAAAAGAACVLVADIDRGGVFAALLGTLELLEADERARIRGFVVNKFRGDLALLAPGIEMIERRIGIPCLGVIPHLDELGLDEEDGVAVADRRSERFAERDAGADRALRAAVVALPHLANYTDFDPLAAEPSVDLRYVTNAAALADADVVLVPGTKRTADDLRWMHARGIGAALRPHLERGLVIGLCGGFQMLGAAIDDPAGTEGGGCEPGFAALPMRTTLHARKTVRPVRGRYVAASLFGRMPAERDVAGYEVHTGSTSYDRRAEPAIVHDAGADGAVARGGAIVGTYVHGVFDADGFRHALVAAARDARGIAPAHEVAWWKREREARIDRWADHVAAHLDLAAIRALVAR
jgi:adenosylcobyric acid synthase